MRVLPVLLLALTLPAAAAELRPEIVRETGKPQDIGALHAVRGIPEACARLEGVFTGEPEQPYKLTVVKSHSSCQPRARFVDFTKAQPSEATGWKFNDLIRVPSAACPSLMAIVRVWRKPGNAGPPKLDAQGRSRIYLKDASEQARSKGMPDLPQYAAEMKLQGNSCR